MLLIRHGFLSPTLCRDLIAGLQQISETYTKADDYVRRWEHRTSICGIAIKRAGIDGVSDQIAAIRQRAADALCQFYNVAGPTHIDFTLATEMRVGDCHPAHADNESCNDDGVWTPNHTSYHHSTALLYLNNCGVDYEGGVLRFPSFEQEIMPQAGMLVGFMCDRTYQHEVTPIQHGRRYAISVWVTEDAKRAEYWD
jgi:predicted 2-oxoglutarate/Fe(II)-dependent dioxygenase YbiX